MTFLGLAGGGFGGAAAGGAIESIPKNVGFVVLAVGVLMFVVGCVLIASGDNKQQPINNNEPQLGTQNTSLSTSQANLQ